MMAFKPILTEKTNYLIERYNCYTFEVPLNVESLEIRKKIEATYSVKVDKVNTLRTRIDRKLKYTKAGARVSRTSAIKKAMVYVAKNHTIDFYNN